MENTLFVLGAQDPEMKKIEELLFSLGYSYSYALDGEFRVNVTNAYSSEHFNFFEASIVYIECNAVHKSHQEILIDHHKEGDRGYDLDYNHFVEASSIGQFLKYIIDNDFSYVTTILDLKVIKGETPKEHMYFEDNNWKYSKEEGTILIPKEMVLLAGIDHCLLDAYKGRCKGISEKDLFRRRINQISVDLNENQEALMFLSKYYKEILNEDIENKTGEIIDLTELDLDKGIYTSEYLILREIAISKEIPIVVKIKFDNREKLMFLSLSKRQTEELLEKGEYKHFKLKNMFGVPNRGYAGGFL